MQVDRAARRVFFFESGRLGNQLLQYAALRSMYPAAQLMFFGLGSLRRAVPVRGVTFGPADIGRASLAGLSRRLLGVLASLRLISVAYEVRDEDVTRFERRAGLFGRWVLVLPSYFQHACFEPLIAPGFDLDPGALADARRFLQEHGATAPGRTPVFVHLRRGDYLHFPSAEAPAALTREWSLAALDAIRRQLPAARWVVCSDDMAHVREWFAGDDAVFCERGELGDLAVMSLCHAGLLSPSSFSWWAAWLARQRLAERGETGLFVAPRYWCGHRLGRWYPAGFTFEWIRYLG